MYRITGAKLRILESRPVLLPTPQAAMILGTGWKGIAMLDSSRAQAWRMMLASRFPGAMWPRNN